MKTFFDAKGITAGLANVVNLFCNIHNINTPINKDYDINERIPLKEWFRILNYLDRHYHKQDLGIQLGKLSRPSDIGIVAYMCMSCENVSQVFDIYTRYQKIWYDVIPVEIVETQDCYIYYWKDPEYLEAGLYTRETMFANDVAFSVFFNFLKNLVKPNDFKIQKIEFTIEKPEDAYLYSDYFECPVIFAAEINQISYFKETLDIKLNNDSDIILKQILQKSADTLLLEYPDEISFKELVSRNIFLAIQNNRTDIQYLSDQIGLSARLLQNRLKQLNTSYSKELNKVRKMLAVEYLEDESLSIHEIAVLLGYHEQTSFNHAFKLWTDQSPNQWRQDKKSEATEF